MSRGDLAQLVNVRLDQLSSTGEQANLHVDARWICRLERGESRWPCHERRAALRDVIAATTNEDLGLYRPLRQAS